jgi:serine/threonine protein kinase/dipeptidyl aminopeptidase/acylaminoacyl peptidase
MSEGSFANDDLSDEQWREVLRLAEEAAALPLHERTAFLEASGAAAEIVAEALTLAGDFTSIAERPSGAGARIGKFQLTHTLGRGGMGEVYAARDTELGRNVALKFLTGDITAHREATRKFLREAQTASALNHPNIVTIHEVVRAGSSIAIVMELVDGESLRQTCQTRVPVERAIDIARQIARALAAAHAEGIIHRDIKPENMILRPDGCVKVLDFGLARHRSLQHSTETVQAGTLRYMSPEQARSEALTSATDIFSFGLVLHELLTGHHAFPERSPLETAHAILVKEPSGDLPGDIPAELVQLVHAMLSKAAVDRPNAELAASQLDRIFGQLQGRQEGTRRSLSFGKRAGVIAVLVLSIVAGAVVLATRARPDTANLTDVTMKPLTSQSGWELAPALSPDGESIAFTWSAKLDGPRQVYVKRDQESEPRALTTSTNGQIGYLAWSPDATRIAFKRRFPDGSGAIDWTGSSGGEEHKVLDLISADLSSSIDWSPDGKTLAFSDSPPATGRPLAIYLYNLQTGERRKLTSPPPNLWGDWNPKFAPDGRTIAFKRVTGFWADDVYLVPAGGGQVKQFTASRHGIWGHAWMPDGKSLLISCQRSGTVFGIWRFPLDAPDRPERIAQGSGDTITPATSIGSRRMAWVNQLWDLNIYRVAAKGDSKPEPVIASTQRDNNPAYSPDGRIAWVSDRSGSREIWLMRADGSGQTQVTHLNGPQVDHLQWSFDGRYLAFDSRPKGYSDIFLLECSPGTLNCGEPQAMGVSPAVEPGWSADSQTIYFSSNRTGPSLIWKRAVSGGQVLQVTQTESLCARESPDGKWLYFSGTGNESAISRVPGSKGAAQPAEVVPIVDISSKAQSEGWALTENELVFIGRPDGARPAGIRAYNLTTGKIRPILDLKEVFLDRGDISLSVSKDGKSILYAQLDRSGSNVIVAEKRP